jgi:hypothetical protein
MTSFVVVPRKGVMRDPDVTWYLQPPHMFLNPETNDINDSSSTNVRKLLHEHYAGDKDALDILKLYLDPHVLEYILHFNLYV